jgi:predicted ester cyclase
MLWMTWTLGRYVTSRRGRKRAVTTNIEREANIALVCQIIEEVINRGNLSLADEGMLPEIATRFKLNVTMLRAAFPDWHFAVDDALAADDKVIIRATLSGVHTGAPYRGKPASGRAVTFSGIDILRVIDGKVVQIWAEYDYLVLLQQLGMAPSDVEIIAANEAAAETAAW